jgi:hypothetical protein
MLGWERWKSRIKQLEAEIIAAELSQIAADAQAEACQHFGEATLMALHPTSWEAVCARYQRRSKAVRFEFCVRRLADEYEKSTGKRATVVTREKERGGGFVEFFADYLADFAKLEDINWPIPAGRLAEKIHYVLYSGERSKPLKKGDKSGIRGKTAARKIVTLAPCLRR